MFRKYQLDIVVRGVDNASNPLGRVSSAIGKIGRIVSGVLIAGGVYRIVDSIKDLGGVAIESYTSLERVEVSLKNLMAREIARGEVIETTSQYFRELTESELERIDDLNSAQTLLSAETVYLTEKYDKAVEKFGEGSYQALKLANSIEEVNGEIHTNVAEMEALTAVHGTWVTVTEQNTIGQKTLGEALALAEGPAKSLTTWIERLGILTPFEEQDVVSALRTAAAYGFLINYASDAVDETERLQRAQEDGVVTGQRLVTALTDVVAGSGLPSEYIKQITVALGQVQAKGKLAAQEIHQLVNAGIGIDVMADAMGMTVGEFKELQEEGKILADDFLPRLIELFERDFDGAAGRVMNTLGGTLISLKAIGRVLLRDFGGPLFKSLTGPLQEFFQYISEDSTREKVVMLGEAFSTTVMNIGGGVTDLAQKLKEAVENASESESFFISLPLEVTSIVFAESALGDAAKTMNEAIFGGTTDFGFEAGNAQAAEGAVTGVAAALIAPKALVAMDIAWKLLSKINWVTGLILVVAGGLGAAWKGNWLGIRDVTSQAWTDHIQPALSGLVEAVEESIPVAIETAKEVWDSTFAPMWADLKTWVADDVVPAVADFIVQLGETLPEAVAETDGWIRETLIPAIDDTGTSVARAETHFMYWWQGFKENAGKVGTWVTTELFPLQQVLEAIGVHFQGPILTFFDYISGGPGATANGIFEVMGTIMQDIVLPAWESFVRIVEPFVDIWDRVATLAEDVRSTFHDFAVLVLTDLLMPILGDFSDLMLNHVVPVVTSLWGLFTDINVVLLELGGEIIEKWIMPLLETFGDWIADKINVRLEKMEGFWTGIKDVLVIIGPIIDALVTGALAAFAGVLEKIAGFLDRIKNGIDGFRQGVQDFDPDLPHLPGYDPGDDTSFPVPRGGSTTGTSGTSGTSTQYYDYSQTVNTTAEAAAVNAQAYTERYERISESG